MRIAIIDFSTESSSKSLSSMISDTIRTEMINSGKFIVIERSQMNIILREMELQQTGCTTDECTVKIGQLLSAQKLLVGTLSRIGSNIVLNGRIVDVEKGISEAAENITIPSDNELMAFIKTFTIRLVSRFEGQPVTVNYPVQSIDVSLISDSENIAINHHGTGYPHPNESDTGWGGGNRPWDLNDGIRAYSNEWARGLAFTGGKDRYSGQECGWRQATINFGSMKEFSRAVIWFHGLDQAPQISVLQYWDGSYWKDITRTSSSHSYLLYKNQNPQKWWEGWSTPMEFKFKKIRGSKFRYMLYNCDIVHGWIYEIEVYAR